MAIAFSCPQCGKKLKAPDNAVGKSSKCPGCGAPVTCPEPVYEAELVDPGGDGPSPFDDLDGDRPYAMSPEPAAAAPGEVRRPCPMCGEMIVATAAKCRFCGEVFDPEFKKAALGGKKGKLRSIATSQRNLQISILLQVVTYIVLIAISGSRGQQTPDPILSLVIMLDAAVLLAAALASIIYTFILSNRIYNVGIAIILTLLTIVPCVSLIVLLMVNQRASQLLKDNGYEIGFFGAKM